MNEGALATLDDDAAIAEIASGVLSRQIAQRYGVSPWAVRKRLSKRPDYPQAIIEQAESFVEQALLEVIECPLDAVAIARARTRFDCAHKWAAARDPARWGQRQQIDVMVDIGQALQQLSDRLRIAAPQHIDDSTVIEHDDKE